MRDKSRNQPSIQPLELRLGLELDPEREPDDHGLLHQVQLASHAGVAPVTVAVTQAAARGIATPATRLPYLDQLQAAFGAEHDLSGIQAHVGGDSAAACDDMNATAFASGNHVAFAGHPDLHTAAHEATHVIQQARGISLYGGVGEAGDMFERQADAVADRVVAGQSAADLLRGPASTPAPSAAERRVQRKAKAPAQASADERHAQHDKADAASGTALGAMLLLAARRIDDATHSLEHVQRILTSGAYDEKGPDGWLADAQQTVDDVAHVSSLLYSVERSIDGSFPELAHPLATLNSRWFRLSLLIQQLGSKVNGSALAQIGEHNEAIHKKLGFQTRGPAMFKGAEAPLPKDAASALKEALIDKILATKQAVVFARMATANEPADVVKKALEHTKIHLWDLESMLSGVEKAKPYKSKLNDLAADLHALVGEARAKESVADSPNVNEIAFASAQLVTYARKH